MASANAAEARGETDLDVLLRAMRPELVGNDWFFASVESPEGVNAMATVREPEGVSVVVDRAEAGRIGAATTHPYRWITLRVHSALDAVGLTAAVSTELTAHGISCNVIAGAFHDHLLVPAARADEALRALAALSARH